MDGNLALFSVVAKEVKANLDVFSLGVLYRVLRDGDCTGVVAEDGGIGEFVSVIQQLLLNPKDLSTATTSSNILGFSGGDGNRDLLLAGPADEAMTQELTSCRCAVTVNWASYMISVYIANKVKFGVTGVPETKRRSSVEITKNPFNSSKMGLLWVGLIASTHTGCKLDVGSGRS